ncbi:MAG: superoxide dismutase, partial [Calditrichae bacterium]|nr:superoxide dismutase [Calditrichia bacterium]
MVSRKVTKLVGIFTMMLLFGASSLYAHCEIPCGIYDDHMRIDMIKENIRTVEKSMNQISELSKENPNNYNQLVRWIDNKEAHAIKIQEIVYQYFMTQRIKPADPQNMDAHKKYLNQLSLLHQMLVHAMKAKQTLDHSHI